MTMLRILLVLCCISAKVLADHYRMTYEDAVVQPHKVLNYFHEESVAKKVVLSKFHQTQKLRLFPYSMTTEKFSTISPQCILALSYLMKHPTSTWTATIYDASAKEPSGLVELALHWVGNFDECYANKPPTNFTGGRAPRSHYCQLFVAAPFYPSQFLIDLGACAPDTCSANDVATYTNISLNGTLIVKEGTYCWKRQEDLPLSDGAIVMIVICGITGVLMLVATAYDVLVVRRRAAAAAAAAAGSVMIGGSANDWETGERYRRFGSDMITENDDSSTSELDMAIQTTAENQSGRICEQLLISFSVIANLEKILDTKQAAGRLNCLDGIRLLSMSWVILGHTYFFAILFPYTSNFGVVNNIAYFADLYKEWSYQAIFNATFSVDTFFLLSGILTSYFFLKEADRMGTINNIKFWILFFVHRFWRLTPVYMLCIGFHTFLVNYFSTGPFWNQSDFFGAEYCKKNWWTNLLYVNNLVRPTEMCLPWSWFLAIDMQLHVCIASLLLPIFFFSRHLTGSCSTFLRYFLAPALWMCGILAALLSSGFIYKFDLDHNKTATQINSDYYIAPWCRMSPYIVGLAVGVLILTHEKRRFKLHWALVAAGWIISTGTCLAVLFGLSGVAANDYKNSNAVTALYWAMSRFSWSVGVSWVIFACLTGYAGWINAFLSWRGFIPLSRLTYCAYLVHPIVMAVVYSSLRQAQVVTSFGMICFFLVHLVISYVVALVMSLAWEAPMRAFERALIRKS